MSKYEKDYDFTTSVTQDRLIGDSGCLLIQTQKYLINKFPQRQYMSQLKEIKLMGWETIPYRIFTEHGLRNHFPPELSVEDSETLRRIEKRRGGIYKDCDYDLSISEYCTNNTFIKCFGASDNVDEREKYSICKALQVHYSPILENELILKVPWLNAQTLKKLLKCVILSNCNKVVF